MTMIRISVITIISMMTIFALTIMTSYAGDVAPVPRENPLRVSDVPVPQPNPRRVQQDLQCGPQGAMLEALRDEHGETPVMAAQMRNPGQIMILTVDGEGGTWTALVGGRNGNACIVAFGDGYITQEAESEPEGQPA